MGGGGEGGGRIELKLEDCLHLLFLHVLRSFSNSCLSGCCHDNGLE